MSSYKPSSPKPLDFLTVPKNDQVYIDTKKFIETEIEKTDNKELKLAYEYMLSMGRKQRRMLILQLGKHVADDKVKGLKEKLNKNKEVKEKE